jgi:hypothetical protein
MANIQLQFRRGTASEWTASNPTLAAGEMGIETDTAKFKIGTGSTTWTGLGYGGIQGYTGSAGITGPLGSTDRAIATFSGSGGSTLQNNTITVSATGTLSAVSGTMTLINPTVTNYVETLFTNTAGTTVTINLTNGTIQAFTISGGNATITMPTAVAGKSFILILTQDSSPRTVTWSTVVWPSAIAPTVSTGAGKRDIFSFFSDGTSWFGATIGQTY